MCIYWIGASAVACRAIKYTHIELFTGTRAAATNTNSIMEKTIEFRWRQRKSSLRLCCAMPYYQMELNVLEILAHTRTIFRAVLCMHVFVYQNNSILMNIIRFLRARSFTMWLLAISTWFVFYEDIRLNFIIKAVQLNTTIHRPKFIEGCHSSPSIRVGYNGQIKIPKMSSNERVVHQKIPNVLLGNKIQIQVMKND